MTRSPLFYPLNRGMDAEAGGAGSSEAAGALFEGVPSDDGSSLVASAFFSEVIGGSSVSSLSFLEIASLVATTAGRAGAVEASLVDSTSGALAT